MEGVKFIMGAISTGNVGLFAILGSKTVKFEGFGLIRQVRQVRQVYKVISSCRKVSETTCLTCRACLVIKKKW